MEWIQKEGKGGDNNKRLKRKDGMRNPPAPEEPLHLLMEN